MTAAVLCLGAAHFDHKAVCAGPVVLGSSNPARTRTTPGGVARNVAENLARLGVAPALLSRVGADPRGDAMMAALAGAGIATDLVSRSPDAPTASYTALLGPGGDLVVAFADMGIYDELTPDRLAPLLPEMGRFPIWFADCNLPAATLRFLLAHRPEDVTIHVDAVSVAKADRLTGCLSGIDTLFANQDEAARLAGIPIRAPLDVCAAADRLLSAGARHVVITRGGDGAFLASGGGAEFLPAVPAEVADVTGAGDAMIAGFLFGRQQGRCAADALRMGLACAALALESPDTVYPGLNPRGLFERAGMHAAPA